MRLIRFAAMLSFLALPAWAQTLQTPSPASAAQARATTPGSSAKVDINSGSQQQLDTLPGIGPVRAKAITAKRPYEELEDLVKKKVLTQNLLNGAKTQMALANVNTSSADQMEKTLPGIGKVRSQAIVTGRPYHSLDDLVAKGVLTKAALEKIRSVATY